MDHNFHILYFLWGKDEETSKIIASEATVSMLSVARHMPGTRVHVYVNRKQLSFFIPFLERYASSISDIKLDTRLSLFSKIHAFYKAIHDFQHFCFLDSDTIVRKSFLPVLPNTQSLLFASYYGTLFCKVTRPEREYLKRYFGDSVSRRVNSGAVYVYQPDRKFWKRMRFILSRIIKTFNDKVDKNNIRTQSFFNDELYFSLTLKKLGVSSKKHVFSEKEFNSYKSKFLKHKRATFLRKDDSRIIEAEKTWQDLGMDLKYFNYQRIKRQ